MYARSARYYDVFHSDKDYAAEAGALHELIQRKRPGARTLLDVGCGTGRHLEHLRASYDVEGVDIQPRLLETAGRRLPGVPLHEADMRTLELGRHFDAVLCLFCGIGYTRTLDGLRLAVHALARHLARNGVLVLEPWLAGPRDTLGPFTETFEVGDVKLARLGYGRAENGTFVTDGSCLVVTPDGVEQFEERHELGLFSRADYEGAPASVGLRSEFLDDRYVCAWP